MGNSKFFLTFFILFFYIPWHIPTTYIHYIYIFYRGCIGKLMNRKSLKHSYSDESIGRSGTPVYFYYVLQNHFLCISLWQQLFCVITIWRLTNFLCTLSDYSYVSNKRGVSNKHPGLDFTSKIISVLDLINVLAWIVYKK